MVLLSMSQSNVDINNHTACIYIVFRSFVFFPTIADGISDTYFFLIIGSKRFSYIFSLCLSLLILCFCTFLEQIKSISTMQKRLFCIKSIKSQLEYQGRLCLVVVDRAILQSKQAIKTFLAVRPVTYKYTQKRLLAFPSLILSCSQQQPSVLHRQDIEKKKEM